MHYLLVGLVANSARLELFYLCQEHFEGLTALKLGSYQIASFICNLGRGSKKNKKKVVILLQPPSIYLPTPIGEQKATFLIFF